jgi:hypothetical protein
MRNKIIIFICMAVLSHTSAFALGKVSRACSLSQFPTGLMGQQILGIFESIGTAPMGSLKALLSLPLEKKVQYWVLESITLDASQSYYLFAESNIVRKRIDLVSGIVSAVDNDRYTSPGFELLSFSNELENYLTTAGSTFVFNRGKLFSSRAGDPNIVTYRPRPYNASWSPFWLSDGIYFEVVGRHFFHNPKTSTSTNMNYSRANSCNLREWGDANAIYQTIVYSIMDR